MKYDTSNLTKYHQKIAQKSIDCVMDGFQLENPPKYVIKGLNPDEEIAKLEFQKFEKNEREIKRLEKDIKFTRNYTSNFVKVVFEFDDNLKKLIYMSDLMKTAKSIVPLHIWCGVLDFPIKNPIIFGRVCNRKRHKGGHYHFGPFEKLKYELTDRLERLEDKIPGIFPYEIIELDLFLELIQNVKYPYDTKEDLKRMVRTVKEYETSPSLIDGLNQKKELIKIMKKIPHFGAVEYAMTRFISDIDVSTICVPYKEVTYFQIDQFVYPPKKHCSAIYSLINVLKELSNL